jgi:hypothetical protein
MATGNAIYPLWKQALMRELDVDKSLDMGDTDPVQGCYLSLVNIDSGGYVYSDGHEFYTSLTNVVGTPTLLTTASVTGRIFAADTIVFTNLTGPKIGAGVITRQNAGTSDTWRLVLYEDTGIVGVPMIPSGGNLIVEWNTQGIFGL